ncbi:MAG: HD domain-containing protein [Candidatus Thorarchaeota archaeon]|nr:MAG: HD domain-containing protein [Candidatus Thorarchaeota archaeon]
MKTDEVISVFMKAQILKSLQRTGWATAGVHGSVIESVADHTYGTTFISLILANLLKAEGVAVDLEKTLTMAVLHDLGERVVSDVPSSSDATDSESFGDAKTALEARAVASILSPLEDLGVTLQSCWAELQQGRSMEARIVRSSDLLDMLVHAITLERSGVDSEILEGFFETSEKRLEEMGIGLTLEVYRLLEDIHRK